ncbi:hypothetical protein C0J52_10306 [Blattella germanica]|nr:hypothetical protein C0J52_10306 [Blattella germanica]
MLVHDNDEFLVLVVFSDKTTFHISSCVNTHNIWIWGPENPQEIVQLECGSPKLNIFCTISLHKVHGFSSFGKATITGTSYFDMLQQWLFRYVPPLPTDLKDFRQRIETVFATITPDTLIKVWEELSYRLDVCNVANSRHIEHL